MQKNVYKEIFDKEFEVCATVKIVVYVKTLVWIRIRIYQKQKAWIRIRIL
jgi:hypothetical protein